MASFRSLNFVCCLMFLNFRVSHSTIFINPSEFYGEFPPSVQNSNSGPHVASTSFVHTVGTVSHILNLDSLMGLSPFHSLFSLGNRNPNHERSRPAYSGLSHPELTWERHIGMEDQSRHEPRGNPVPTITTQPLSFSDYVQKATYDWLKKYKMAYYSEYFQNRSRVNPTEPPDPFVRYTVSDAPSNSTNATTTDSPKSSTQEPPATETNTLPPTTSTPTTTTSTTTTKTIPTTTRFRFDESMNEIRVGFLPDQPNLGTRWFQNMDLHNLHVPTGKS